MPNRKNKRNDKRIIEREMDLLLQAPEFLKNLRKARKEIKGMYWTLKKKGRQIWLYPSSKLRKQGKKPFRIS